MPFADPQPFEKVYPLSRWIKDFQAMAKEGALPYPVSAPSQTQHPSASEDQYRQRLLLAHRYLIDHLPEFDQTNFLVAAESGSFLVKDELLASLYLCFVQSPIIVPHSLLPVEVVISAAKVLGKKRTPDALR